MQLLLGLLCRYGPAELRLAPAEVRRDADACGQAARRRISSAIWRSSSPPSGRAWATTTARIPSAGAPSTARSGWSAASAAPRCRRRWRCSRSSRRARCRSRSSSPRTPSSSCMLVRVLDALNERYMLLRACGLDPEVLARSRRALDPAPARDEAAAPAGRGADAARHRGRQHRCLSARLQPAQGRRRASSPAARASTTSRPPSRAGMLRYASLSLDDPLGPDEDGDEWAQARDAGRSRRPGRGGVSDPAPGGRPVGALLIDDRPDWFDPLMAYFFRRGDRQRAADPRRPGRSRGAARCQVSSADRILSRTHGLG